jgi:hypothetical protein
MKSTTINPINESSVADTDVQEYGSVGEEINSSIFNYSIDNLVVVNSSPCYLLLHSPSPFHSNRRCLVDFRTRIKERA